MRWTVASRTSRKRLDKEEDQAWVEAEKAIQQALNELRMKIRQQNNQMGKEGEDK